MSGAELSSLRHHPQLGAGVGDRISSLLLRREYYLPLLLLVPPLLWGDLSRFFIHAVGTKLFQAG
jgi:hypothetical protein